MTPPRGGTLEVDVEGEAKVARRDAVDEAVLPQQRGAFVRHAADLHTPAPQKQRQKLSVTSEAPYRDTEHTMRDAKTHLDVGPPLLVRAAEVDVGVRHAVRGPHVPRAGRPLDLLLDRLHLLRLHLPPHKKHKTGETARQGTEAQG